MAGEQNLQRMKLRRVHVLVVLLVGLVAFVLYIGGQVTMPIRSRTLAHIRCIRERIVEHYRQNGKLPDDLTFLAELDPPVKVTDLWGRKIIYERVSQDEVILMSLGADGRPGGEGDDMDISVDLSVVDSTSRNVES